jgi:hypothetical protein
MRIAARTLCVGLLLCCFSTVSRGDIVALTWFTTVSSASGAHPGIVGETLKTTILVDNGGSSLFSQTWNPTDFISYRADGGSGWFFEGYDINLASSGTFSTDAAGNVITAGQWFGNWPNDNVLTSWDGATLGGWWNNGNNEVHAASTNFAGLFATNVAENQLGSSWNAAFAIPEPGSVIMLGLVAFGCAVRRNRR